MSTATATNKWETPEFNARVADEERISAEQERARGEREAKHRAAQQAADKARDEEAQANLAAIEDAEREAESRRREADRILREGRPFDYFIKTYQLDHEGDLTIARCMALVFAASAVANGDGLNCLISGSSGRGKSHSAKMMFRQLPDKYRYDLSFSDRYLFYAGEEGGLCEGAVILIDDQTLSETAQEVFKVSVSGYGDPAGVQYGTVMNQKAKLLKIPSRLSWILLKVDDPGDDQTMNRLIQCRVDEREEKVIRSARKIQSKYKDLHKKTVTKDRKEIQICREMWARIKLEPVAVEVPCSGHVRFADYQNLRNHELFFNLLMSHAVIHRLQRNETGVTEDGTPIILATEQDYREAKLIFEALHVFGGQRHNTLTNEDQVVKSLIKIAPPDGIFTIRDVANISNMPYMTIRRALKGRDGGKAGNGLGGLLEKCPAIQSKGRRAQYELESDQVDHRGNREITRKEHFNEEVFWVDLERLKIWEAAGEAVWLEGFKWSDRS